MLGRAVRRTPLHENANHEDDLAQIFNLNLAEASVQRHQTQAEAEARFMALAAEIGLDTRDIHFGVTADLVRCATLDDKAGKRSGWYVIHEERGLMYGALGNWKTDHTYVKFVGRDERHIDDETMRRIAEKQETRRREAAELRRKNAAEAAAVIQWLKPADPSHPYLMRKRIGPNGALAMGANILLPIYDLEGNVVSTQEIGPDGEKSFRPGCTSKGVYVIGGPTPNYVICEGFATGASIHEATGMRVYVTFNAGNMASLAPEIAEREGREGGARAVIAGDHDRPNPMTGERIGQKKAEQAADAIGGALVLIPEGEGDDWNDVAVRNPKALQAAFATVRPCFQSWQIEDFAALPRRQWLYGQHYIRKFCSLTVAPGGLGKSTLVLMEAVAMATGRPLLGVAVPQRLKVIYFNAEDPLDEIKARVAAICIAFKIDQSELVGQLFVASGRDQELNLAQGEAGDLIEAAFQMVSGFVRYYGVDAVILDPLANMHDSPETNELMRRLGRRLSRLAEERNCAIEIVHHTRKLNGNEATVEDSRGGSALIGAVRAARVLNPMSAEEATRFGLPTHIDHFKIEAAGKSNLARSAEKAEWFERFGVLLPNGDWVASLRRWDVPDPFEGITPELTRKVQQAVAEAAQKGHGVRENVQSGEWVGHIVAYALDLKVTDAASKARIKSLIRQWIATDILRIDEAHDKRAGRKTSIVVVGENRV